MSGLGVYLIFNALKCHFFSNYDYFHYCGVLSKYNQESYKNVSEKERKLYEKFSRKYNNKETLEGFFVANLLLASGRIAIANLNDQESSKNYLAWHGRTSAISNTVLTDIKWLLSRAPGGTSKTEVFNWLFRPPLNTNPPILTYLLRSQISIESFLCLDFCIEFFEDFDRRLNDDLVWENARIRCNKYRPFLKKIVAKEKGLALAVASCVEGLSRAESLY